jgi:hypothetical protein
MMTSKTSSASNSVVVGASFKAAFLDQSDSTQEQERRPADRKYPLFFPGS